jgi:hypothetical protein
MYYIWWYLSSARTRALDKVLDFRDKLDNPTARGMSPAAIEWFYSEELPTLMLLGSLLPGLLMVN